MSNSYIKFKALENGIRRMPEHIGAGIVEVISTTVIPIANPDFENKIDEVSTWLIEFEGDSYYPNREVGLDISNNPILIMPWKKNYGYWTDNNVTLEEFKSHFNSINITKEEFEKFWKMFEEKN